MTVTVVWDTWLKSGAEAEGLRLTRQVWSDMLSFEGTPVVDVKPVVRGSTDA